MRKRNVHIQFWLDKKEAEAFQKKVFRYQTLGKVG